MSPVVVAHMFLVHTGQGTVTSWYLRGKDCTWYILGVPKSVYQAHTSLCRSRFIIMIVYRYSDHTQATMIAWYIPVLVHWRRMMIPIWTLGTNPFPKPIENVALSAKWNVQIWNRLRDCYSRLYTGTLKSGCLQSSNFRRLKINLKSSGCDLLLEHF